MNKLALKNSGNNSKVSMKKASTGVMFNPESDVWEVDINRTIKLDHLYHLERDIHASVRKVLTFFAENRSIDYTYGVSYALALYIKETEATTIELVALLNFKASLSKYEIYKFSVLRGFLKKWYQLGYVGVDKVIINEIYKYKIPGNKKGAAVKSLDPENGPYSDIEFEAIRDKSITNYAEGLISLENMVISSLIIESGRRGIQISFLRIKDFMIDTSSLETPFHLLNIPRAKQRNSSFRTTFKQFAMNDQLGSLMNEYTSKLKNKLRNTLGPTITEDELSEFPLFPWWDKIHESDKISKDIKGRAFHRASSAINQTLVKTVTSLNITSERTSEQLKVSCIRFRYTLGTRAAREGFGKSIIAELLDHNDNQNADIYTKNVPEKGAKISSFMDAKLIEFANAFQGNIVSEEKNAERGGDISSRIESEDGDNVGTCGSSGSCYDNAPIACYLCKRFQPWVDAPHRLVLDKLVSDRNKTNEKTGDETIAAINDRAIIAVMQVMKKCAQRKILGENNE
jgi:integrase